jgi:hypothetical protein
VAHHQPVRARLGIGIQGHCGHLYDAMREGEMNEFIVFLFLLGCGLFILSFLSRLNIIFYLLAEKE